MTEYQEMLRRVLGEELRARLEFTILPVSNVISVFVDKDCNVYAGTYRGKPAQLLRSVDGGFTWTKIFEDADATRLTAIYVTEEGYILVGTEAPARLYLSTDGGRTWVRKLDFPVGGYLRDIVEDQFGHLYASWSAPSGYRGEVYKSVDRGETWSRVWQNPAGEYAILTMYRDPFKDRTIYFHHGTETTGRVAKTEDGFETPPVDLPVLIGAFTSISSSWRMRFFCEDADHWMFRTRDDENFEGILSMNAFPYDMATPWSVAVSPLGNLYVGAFKGEKGAHVWVSPDLGDTWRVLFRLRGTLVQNFAFSPDGWVYAALTTYPKDKPVRLTDAQGLLAKWRDTPLPRGEDAWTDIPFDSAEIRDTYPHYSWWRAGYPDLPVTVCLRGYRKAVVAIHNELDQDISVQVQGCYHQHFDLPFVPAYRRKVWDIGASFTVSAGGYRYETLTDMFPYIRLRIAAAVAPTSGAVNAWVFKAGRI